MTGVFTYVVSISVLGLTIDYGPYAFMDVFDSYHICNHTDEEGRYAYKVRSTLFHPIIHSFCSSTSPT